MRTDAIKLEETRLTNVPLGEMPVLHERHRIFPQVFENRNPLRTIDVAAGVGYVAQRIQQQSPTKIFANDISPTCLRELKGKGIPSVSFTIDHPIQSFPFADGSYDSVIALATIEHVIHVDRFVQEIRRILKKGGHFYVSAPNYAGLMYLKRLVWSGRTFHNPLSTEESYEFYAHVRYFTYRTLLDYVSSFGFVAEAVYVPLPNGSTRFLELKKSSPWKAWLFNQGMNFLYHLSPRWCSEPVLCFRKDVDKSSTNTRKVIL